MVSFVTTSISLFLLSISLFFTRLTNGYHLSLTPLDWSSANTYCQLRCQSTLASIHTTQQYFIAKEILSNHGISSNEYIWFGLNNKDTPDTFQYIDGTGSTNLPLWASNQPDTSSSTSHCVAMKNNQWFNKDCDNNKYKFFCNSCDAVVNKQYSPSLDDTFTTKTAAADKCGTNSMADIDTFHDGLEAKLTLGYNSGATAWVNADECQQINEAVAGFTDMYSASGVADVSCDAAPQAPVLCSMQSEICKAQNQWEVLHAIGGPGAADVTWDDACGMSIKSQHDDTIVGLSNKAWKTCGDEKPFVVEMKYRTRSPGAKSRTGLVFYPHNAADPDDHYYVEIHPIEQMVNLGYIRGNIDVTLVQAGYTGLAIDIQDMIWETLRVEVYLGHVFFVYLNGIAVIPGAPIVHYELNAASYDVMSGYVGIQSKYGDIDVKYLYASGMEVYYDNTASSEERQLLTQWMQQCSFDPVDDKDINYFATPSPTTSAPTTATPTTTTTTTGAASNTYTPSPTPPSPTTSTTATSTTAQTATDSTASSSNIPDGLQSGSGGGNGDDATDAQPHTDNGGSDINIDTDTENNNDAFVTGAEDGEFVIPPLFVYVPIAAGVLCCMIIVGIYYCRLKTSRNKKRELEGIFGRQSISMSSSNASSKRQRDMEIASHIQEAVRQERGNQNVMDPNDVELELEGDDINAVPGTNMSTHARTSSTVWADNRLYHPSNNPQRQDIRDSVIMSTWDVEALEMDCNDIIKSNNKMPGRWRARAYSD